MIVVSGVVEIDPEDRDTALEAASRMAQASRQEEGCHAYAFYVDVEDPGRIRVFEEWESQEALDAHFQTEHMAEFRRALGGLRIRGRRIHRYEVSDRSEL